MKDKKAYKRRKREVKFSDKTNPKLSVIALLLGICAFIIMLVMVILSVSEQGEGPAYLGAFGMASILLTLIGFILAVRSFRGNNIYYRVPVISSAVNGIFLVLFICLYTLGFV